MLRTGALKGLLRRSGGIGRSLTFVGEPRERASASTASWAAITSRKSIIEILERAALHKNRYARGYARGWQGRVLQNQRDDQLWPPLTLPALLCADVHQPPVETAQRPGASSRAARAGFDRVLRPAEPDPSWGPRVSRAGICVRASRLAGISARASKPAFAVPPRAPCPQTVLFLTTAAPHRLSLQKGQVYYWNTKTNKTQWNEPQGFDMKH